MEQDQQQAAEELRPYSNNKPQPHLGKVIKSPARLTFICLVSDDMIKIQHVAITKTSIATARTQDSLEDNMTPRYQTTYLQMTINQRQSHSTLRHSGLHSVTISEPFSVVRWLMRWSVRW